MQRGLAQQGTEGGVGEEESRSGAEAVEYGDDRAFGQKEHDGEANGDFAEARRVLGRRRRRFQGHRGAWRWRQRRGREESPFVD